MSKSEDFWMSYKGLVAIMGIFLAVVTLGVMGLAYVLDDSDKPCSEMGNYSLKTLPARCAAEFGVTK